jgi:hypothetical protein
MLVAVFAFQVGEAVQKQATIKIALEFLPHERR